MTDGKERAFEAICKEKGSSPKTHIYWQPQNDPVHQESSSRRPQRRAQQARQSMHGRDAAAFSPAVRRMLSPQKDQSVHSTHARTSAACHAASKLHALTLIFKKKKGAAWVAKKATGSLACHMFPPCQWAPCCNDSTAYCEQPLTRQT